MIPTLGVSVIYIFLALSVARACSGDGLHPIGIAGTIRRRYQGTYSQGVSMGDEYLATMMRSMPNCIAVEGCCELNPERLFDVAVTDPPHGFNTNEEKRR
ncbi:MAG: hypothetical protein WAL71_17050 [Terriglobales bacterium]|jgi:hypothetical protein